MIDKIEVLTHSSIRIRSDIGTIYVDPFRMKEEPNDADFVFITHPHYDHFSIEDIRKVIRHETVMVVPEKMKDDAMEFEHDLKSIETFKPGTCRKVSGLEIEAVPAYNTLKPFHPRRAEWIGYILTIEGKRIYITGDTGATKEARKVKCDIVLLPIGGTYTMDAKRAAELVHDISPEYAIPTHYGCTIGKKRDGQTFSSLVKGPIKVIEKMQYFE